MREFDALVRFGMLRRPKALAVALSIGGVLFPRILGVVACFLCLCVNAQNASQTHSDRPISTTFCEVAKNSKKFNGKEVSFLPNIRCKE